ncbi:unnamed protein product [Caenorhabditis brenneri]
MKTIGIGIIYRVAIRRIHEKSEKALQDGYEFDDELKIDEKWIKYKTQSNKKKSEIIGPRPTAPKDTFPTTAGRLDHQDGLGGETSEGKNEEKMRSNYNID